METSENKSEGKCGCPCHKMFGVFIALVGVVGLLAVFGVFSHQAAAIAASVLLILAGLQTMFRGKCKCCNAA
jgi:hypothetical protein